MAVMPGAMSRKPYPCNSSDSQWEELAPLLPPEPPRGHPGTTASVRWSTQSGTCCRATFPAGRCPTTCCPGARCGGAFGSGVMTGPGNGLRKHCGPGFRKRRAGKLIPSVAIIDRQSVKATETGGLAATTPASG